MRAFSDFEAGKACYPFIQVPVTGGSPQYDGYFNGAGRVLVGICNSTPSIVADINAWGGFNLNTALAQMIAAIDDAANNYDNLKKKTPPPLDPDGGPGGQADGEFHNQQDPNAVGGEIRGSVIIDQLFRFSCDRCKIEPVLATAPAVNQSGYRITQLVTREKNAPGRRFIHVQRATKNFTAGEYPGIPAVQPGLLAAPSDGQFKSTEVK